MSMSAQGSRHLGGPTQRAADASIHATSLRFHILDHTVAIKAALARLGHSCPPQLIAINTQRELIERVSLVATVPAKWLQHLPNSFMPFHLNGGGKLPGWERERGREIDRERVSNYS